jgi:hypothetical protein
MKNTYLTTVNLDVSNIFYYRLFKLSLAGWTDTSSTFYNLTRYIDSILESLDSLINLNGTIFENFVSVDTITIKEQICAIDVE